MLKPRRSAGGHGIFVWEKETVRSSGVLATLGQPHYFQERAEGESISALFLSEDDRISLVGVARLLMARVPDFRFGYGGAIGPISISPELESRITEAGRVVGKNFSLRGLWGMDFVADGSRVWATEVNPRYTATVEIYEHAFGIALLSFHRQACEQWKPTTAEKSHWGRMPWLGTEIKTPCVGKVVIYADRELQVPPWGDWPKARDSLLSDLPTLADRPRAGSILSGGFPLCSLLAAGQTERDCRAALNLHLGVFQTHFTDAGIPLNIPWVSTS
jgi:predicted ATP-grasp superfamily ATP-dependent carboligase